jgi:hypothetical protein
MRSVEQPVFLAGPPASGLPWWAPIAVSVVLLLIARAYVLWHRRRRTPDDGATESLSDAPPLPTHHDAEGPDRPTSGIDTQALVRGGSGA